MWNFVLMGEVIFKFIKKGFYYCYKKYVISFDFLFVGGIEWRRSCRCYYGY